MSCSVVFNKLKLCWKIFAPPPTKFFLKISHRYICVNPELSQEGCSLRFSLFNWSQLRTWPFEHVLVFHAVPFLKSLKYLFISYLYRYSFLRDIVCILLSLHFCATLCVQGTFTIPLNERVVFDLLFPVIFHRSSLTKWFHNSSTSGIYQNSGWNALVL